MTADAPRRTALEPLRDRVAAVGGRVVDLAAQVSVRVDAQRAASIGLPIEPNTWSRIDGEHREGIWLGPDEWLLVSDAEPASDVVRDVDARLDGEHRSVVDVSASRVALDLVGDRRAEILAAGCGLDLHPRSWRAGSCAQTLLAHVPVLLQERDDATRLLVRPSFAGWLVAWVERAAG